MIESARAALAGGATILCLGIVMLVIDPEVAGRAERLQVSPFLTPIWAIGWLLAPLALWIGARRGRMIILILTGQFRSVGSPIWTQIGNVIILLAGTAAVISITNEVANGVRRAIIGA